MEKPMVKVTLEFANLDAAIVALGKLAGAPSAPSKGAAEVAQASVTGAPATRTRKGRSDKGQPRGEYKPRSEKSEPAGAGGTETTTGAAPAPQTAPAGEASLPPAEPIPETPTATREQAVAALEDLVKRVNLDAGLKLLQQFGVERLRALPDEKLGEFVAAAKAAK